MAEKRKEQQDDVSGSGTEPKEASEKRKEKASAKTEPSRGAEPAKAQASARAPEPDRGQVKVWLLIGVAVVVAGIILMRREPAPEGGTAPVAAGAVVSGDITLVTADRNELDCMAASGIQTHQCGYVDDKTPRQIEERDKLRPFMTLDRRLYLVPGLFLEPAIAERYKSEPPNKPRDQLKRFTAKCKIKILGELDAVKLRWSPNGQWEPPKKFQVATASECKIEG